MRVYWTDNAVEHLVSIYEYIALNSLAYAKQMVDKITRRLHDTRLSTHPIRLLLKKRPSS